MKIERIFEKVQSGGGIPEIRLYFKMPKRMRNKPFDDAESMVKFLRKHAFDDGSFDIQEEMILLGLDDNQCPIGFYRIAKGTVGEVGFYTNIFFPLLYLMGADSFVLAHNHPNGNLKPSKVDVDNAYALQHKAQYLGFKYMDALILTRKGYFSFSESDLLWYAGLD